MLKGLIIILVLSFNTLAKAQVSINFFPKMLQKELNTGNGNGKEIEPKEITMPENISRQVFLGRFYSLGQRSGTYKYYYVGRVKTCRAGGCSLVQKTDADSEYFDYFIIYDSMCAVQKVGVYNYQATHGHGITAKGWLKQFSGYNGAETQKKVDAISGATISVDAITFDIEHKTDLIKQLVSINVSR